MSWRAPTLRPSSPNTPAARARGRRVGGHPLRGGLRPARRKPALRKRRRKRRSPSSRAPRLSRRQARRRDNRAQMTASFSIAHVTPSPWEAEDNEVNAHVKRVTAELSRRGHRVLVLAPSRSQERVRASRKALRAARKGSDGLSSLLEGTDRGTPRVIAVGEVLDLRGATSALARRRPSALPIDVARTVEELLGMVELDFVHVHEPLAPR